MNALETSKLTMGGLASGFLRSVERFPSRSALFVEGRLYTYEALARMANGVAATISSVERDETPLIGLLAHRSSTAYAGILGILLAGKGYVPLNPKLPIERLAKIFLLSGARTLLVGKEAVHILERLLEHIPYQISVLYPLDEKTDMTKHDMAPHRFIFFHTQIDGPPIHDVASSHDDTIVYLLFTSGSTGEPKGVPVRCGNVRSYVNYICTLYEVTEKDRFSQVFDLSFDLSVHDMFVCWERGACLYSIPDYAVMAPAKFIRDHQITMWFSVPSLIGVMSQLALLKPGSFPSLRGSLFCGEPLPRRYAELWQEASPNSFIENLYGPTETTIAITHYRWDPVNSPTACLNGIVPIGWTFPEQCAHLIGIDGPCSEGTFQEGELCLSGSQVTGGYWNAPEKTANKFLQLPPLSDSVWYRTGDVVRQDSSGCLYYLGRIDHQVKIMGHRVELEEIDVVLRDIAGVKLVASIASPVKDGLAQSIITFVGDVLESAAADLLRVCRDHLPEYMVPKRIYCIETWPVNLHGKTDRHKLISLLEEIH